MWNVLEIYVIAVLISLACAIPGSFLLLRKLSMMTDAITHTILLGVVVTFFVVKDFSSPFFLLGATVMGVVTVWLTQLVSDCKLVEKDAAIGYIFPLLFSIAVIFISKYGGNLHLDLDSVLLGELTFAPFQRLVLFGKDVGAKGIYLSGFVLFLNIIYHISFFKELKVTTFDPIFARSLGISTGLIHYSFMTTVSLTAVAAFETAGCVLVIAFMICPAAAAYLLTHNLKYMIFLSCFFGIFGSILGIYVAFLFDVSIAGCIALVLGFIVWVAFFARYLF